MLSHVAVWSSDLQVDRIVENCSAIRGDIGRQVPIHWKWIFCLELNSIADQVGNVIVRIVISRATLAPLAIRVATSDVDIKNEK